LSNPVFTQLSDGTNAIGSAIGTAAGATDAGFPMLAIRDDVLSTLADAEGDYVGLRVDSTGALHITGNITASPESVFVDDSAFVVGTDEVSAVGGVFTTDTVDSGDVGAFAMNANRVQRIAVEDDAGDQLAVNADGSINANVTLPASLGDEVHDYDTASALASDTADNHDYTITGSDFELDKVEFGSSGGMKAEIQTGPLASLATVAVGFIPKHGGHSDIDFSPNMLVDGGVTAPTIRVIRTNRQGGAQDVYSTIMGRDIV
jgi:hypothetical protein